MLVAYNAGCNKRVIMPYMGNEGSDLETHAQSDQDLLYPLTQSFDTVNTLRERVLIKLRV